MPLGAFPALPRMSRMPQPRTPLPCTWTSKPVLTTISGIQAYKNGLQGLSATYLGVVRFTGALGGGGEGSARGVGACLGVLQFSRAAEANGFGKPAGSSNEALQAVVPTMQQAEGAAGQL